MSQFEQRFHANSQQAEYWNTVAGPKWVQHDAAMDIRLRPLAEELLRRVSLQSTEWALDIGCGGGTMTELIANAVGTDGKVLGVDISEPLLELARTRCAAISQVSFNNADAQVHPFADQEFDALLSRFGVMFFSDPIAAFTNLAKALRPGGRLHFVCWAPIELNPWFTVALDVATRHFGAPEPTPPRAPGPLAFSDKAYVEDILGRGGFSDVSIDTVATKMTSPEPVEAQADLYLKLGPAARLLSAAAPDSKVMDVLTQELITELNKHRSNDGIALDATVHFVSARMPP